MRLVYYAWDKALHTNPNDLWLGPQRWWKHQHGLGSAIIPTPDAAAYHSLASTNPYSTFTWGEYRRGYK